MAPSRNEVESILRALIIGTETREFAATWAMPFVLEGGVDDPAVWEAITSLGAADSIGIDRPYLYTEIDFRDWLDELERE